MLLGVVHKSSDILVCIAELHIFALLKADLLLEKLGFVGKGFRFENILKKNIVGDIYYKQENDKSEVGCRFNDVHVKKIPAGM